MSAIFGISHFDGMSVDKSELHFMAGILAHRGPDGFKLWSQESVAVGHRMLWTTPESLREHLPFVDSESGNVVTADVRLDNRDDLISSLGIEGHVTDSQIVFSAYDKWGERCAEHLLGDFIFVIWDARKQVLFGARDQLGVKHLYYYHSPGRSFVFASEPKGIFCHRRVPKRLNEVAIADHLLPYYEDRVSTSYEDILRLPASHYFVVGRNGLRITQYWQPDLSKELRLHSDREYEEGFREVFRNAVRCRLRSAFPVGTMLSGGLDSSSISCMASVELAKTGRGPLQTFSGIFPSLSTISPKIDERSFAEAVIAKAAAQPHCVRVDAFSPLNEIDKILWHLDNSLPATNMYLDWAIFKRAREQGVRVLFSGNDGDSVISFGLEDFAEYARRGKWFSLVHEAWFLARWSKKPYHSFKNYSWNYGLRTLAPESARRNWRRFRGRPADPSSIPAMPAYCAGSLINPEFEQRVSLTERVWHLQNLSYPPGRTTRQHHWNCISSGMDHFLLESFEKGGGAHAVELRYPFFDRRVVEFCLALPPGQRLRSGWTRSILRRSMQGILPPEVQWRVGKADLSANFKLKLLEYERHTLDDAILNSQDILEDYVDLPAARRAYQTYLANPMLSKNESFHIALVTNLALWLRNAKSQMIPANSGSGEGATNLRPHEMGSSVAEPELVNAATR